MKVQQPNRTVNKDDNKTMKYFYVWYVYHQYVVCCDNAHQPVHETKTIGVNTQYRLAEQAVEQIRSKPGFTDYPEGFRISKKRCYVHLITGEERNDTKHSD